MIKILFSIAAGGAIGAVLRYLTASTIYTAYGRSFPYGTLVVNVVGSFLMGFLSLWLIERINAGPALRAFALVGLLGAYTTFSTFSIETFHLIEAGEAGKAFVNAALSVVLCVAAVTVGLVTARHLS
ncbi:MAG: fluoride efflux transporter CrcB [Gammaproteobacteria bacterium]